MNESLSTDQVFITKLTEIVLDNLTDEGFSVERLAQEVGMSRANLYRRLKSIKDQDVSRFIREVRLQRAMEMLRNKQGTAAEISFRVGFGSPAYFNKCFHEYYGYSPGKVKHMGSLKKKDKPDTSNKWKIASYISIIVIIALIVLYILPRTIRSIAIANLEKSIAVLPFINDSPDEKNTSFINGLMDDLIINLQSIEDLKVLGRTSVEQYRNSTKSIPEIARELGVNYIVGGSGQKDDNTIKLRIWLSEGTKGTQLWGDKYERKWEDVFSIQDEIAYQVAKELKAVITPEEKQLIEKPPTISTTAWDFYQRGMYEHFRYWSEIDNIALLDKAEGFYHKALDYDSTYALAYAGLALISFDKHHWEAFSENVVDSTLILADKALSFDDELTIAFVVRGLYYVEIGNMDQAMKEFDDALKIDPNSSGAYAWKAWLYSFNDVVQSFDNLQKAMRLERGSELDDGLRGIGMLYLRAGFSEEHNSYIQEALELDDDSIKFYLYLIRSEIFHSNYEKAIELAEKAFEMDSINTYIVFELGLVYMYLDQYEKSIKYFEKYIEGERGRPVGLIMSNMKSYFGLVYWQNGDKEKAEYYFKQQIDRCNKLNESGRQLEQEYFTYYNLAGVYAFRGEKDKAYKNLRIFNQTSKMYLENVFWINNDPLFNSIRDEPEFQQIVKEVEAKYEEEHERVRQWLEENDML
jgi:TolB-like protein/AraC-like DNA-binding protein/Tfp pilus assembly protein PilF